MAHESKPTIWQKVADPVTRAALEEMARYVSAGPLPAFAAYPAVAQTTSGTTVKVNFGAPEFNVGGEYDPATSMFRPRDNGIWVISASAGASSSVVDGAKVSLFLYKNGARHRTLNTFYMGAASLPSIGGATIIQADPTAYYEIYIRVTSGTVLDIGADDSFFGGTRLPDRR